MNGFARKYASESAAFLRSFDMSDTVPFRDIRRALESAGWKLVRVRGSHHVFTKAEEAPVVVPVHGGRVKRVYKREVEKAVQGRRPQAD